MQRAQSTRSRRSSPQSSRARSKSSPKRSPERLLDEGAPEALRRTVEAVLSTWRPPPRLTVSEWADTYRYLSPESSSEPGRWRTSRVPYLREFMDAAREPGVTKVVGIFASQLGKTESIKNIIGYHVHQDPAPLLALYPTLEMAETFSKDRLSPMVRDTPALRGLIKDPRSRDSENTIRHKRFTGGHITIAGTNSAASLSSRPIRVLLCDEVDRFAVSAGTEGDPLKLGETRQRSFWNRIGVYITTPRDRGASRSEPLWQQSDQRVWLVPCPDCGTEQTLKWAQVHWDKDAAGDPLPETAVYVCEACGVLWDDPTRRAAVRRGRWEATKAFRGIAGFHLNVLNATLEAVTLKDIVEQWVEAQGNPELLKVFFNTCLAEWYEEKYHTLRADDYAKRRETYPSRDGVILVPRPVVLMTAGVDVQDDRVEVQIDGWSVDEQCYKLEYHVLDGNPERPALWDDLWELLCRPRQMERGGLDYIRATCVDTGGHYTQEAYRFCRPRWRVRTPDDRRAYVFAVKGSGGPGTLWPREPTRNNKGGIRLYTIKVDAAKEILYGRLQRVVEPGPGYIHFPDRDGFDGSFFKQLTGEKRVPRTDRKGFTHMVWEKKRAGGRVEALDTAVYSLAALHGLYAMGLNLEREARLAEIDREVPEGGEPAADESPAPRPEAPPPAPRRRRRARRRTTRSAYLGG